MQNKNIGSKIEKIFRTLVLKAKHVSQKMQGKQFVHFLHIGKTGGSAIKYAIEPYLATSSPYIIYLHPHRVRLRDVPKGESIVFFLRDPISRFVSGFYSRQRQGQPRYFNPWSPDEKIAFEHFSTPNHLAIALSSSDEEDKEKAQMAMRSIGHIKTSYWDWFESEKYFKSRLADIFFIGFQEQLAEDFEILKLKLSLPDSVKLPNDNIKSHKNPAKIDRLLEDKATINLKNWYKDEFKFINLCNEIISRLQ